MNESHNQIPVRVSVAGFEDRALFKELAEFLKQQGEINRLVSRIIVPKDKPGIAVELRMPNPEIVELAWRDYRIRATGFNGELFIVCKKLTDGLDLPPR